MAAALLASNSLADFVSPLPRVALLGSCCLQPSALLCVPCHPPSKLPSPPCTLQQIPEEEALQFGVQQEPPPSENGSSTSRRKSPGTIIREAASWIGLTRTPRQQSAGSLPAAAAARPGSGRMSVNPLARAAADAKYATTVDRGDSGKVGAGLVARGVPWAALNPPCHRPVCVLSAQVRAGCVATFHCWVQQHLCLSAPCCWPAACGCTH